MHKRRKAFNPVHCRSAPKGNICLQEISARRVASAVVLHVQQLGWAAQRDLNLEEEWQLIRHLMQDAGINVDGVVNQIVDQLDHVRHCVAQHAGHSRAGCYAPHVTSLSSIGVFCGSRTHRNGNGTSTSYTHTARLISRRKAMANLQGNEVPARAQLTRCWTLTGRDP